MRDKTIADKKARGLCLQPYCTRPARRNQRKWICCTCENKFYDKAYPLRVVYRNKKKDAKRRRIWFDPALTYYVFAQWCHRTGYATERGRTGLALTIHRKNNKIGYTLSNLEALTNSENASIGNRKPPPLPIPGEIDAPF